MLINKQSLGSTKGPVSFLSRLLRTRIFIKLLILFLFVIVFWGGYQLAVYQGEKSDNYSLPHFNTNQCKPCQSTYCYPSDSIDYGLCSGIDKPVIYLYPSKTERVNVKVSYPSSFKQTIPLYNPVSGWSVLAQPNGTLTNLADNKTYPYLFWEGNPALFNFDMSKGFVISGANTSAFLENQLTKMGLNQAETNAFLQYWLPKMVNNPYNLVHFAGYDYTSVVKLQIFPQPDSLLRVFMAFKPLDSPIRVTSQSFPIFHRNGFTAVEWGGTELGSN